MLNKLLSFVLALFLFLSSAAPALADEQDDMIWGNTIKISQTERELGAFDDTLSRAIFGSMQELKREVENVYSVIDEGVGYLVQHGYEVTQQDVILNGLDRVRVIKQVASGLGAPNIWPVIVAIRNKETQNGINVGKHNAYDTLQKRLNEQEAMYADKCRKEGGGPIDCLMVQTKPEKELANKYGSIYWMPQGQFDAFKELAEMLDWDKNAIKGSSAGALGEAQIMPLTLLSLNKHRIANGKRPLDPFIFRDSVEIIGTKLMEYGLKNNSGYHQVYETARYYNAGGNKDRSPNIAKEYGEHIVEWTKIYRGELDVPVGLPVMAADGKIVMTASFLDKNYRKKTGVPHWGLDFAPLAEFKSNPYLVRSAMDGTAYLVEWKKGSSYAWYGRHVIVKSGPYLTIYAHLSTDSAAWMGYTDPVSPSERKALLEVYGSRRYNAPHKPSDIQFLGKKEVRAGNILAYMGSTGASTAKHLHYEVRKNNKPINPLTYYAKYIWDWMAP